MHTIQLEKITIYALDTDEYENTTLKNKCIIQTQKEYIAFIKSDKTEDSTVAEEVCSNNWYNAFCEDIKKYEAPIIVYVDRSDNYISNNISLDSQKTPDNNSNNIFEKEEKEYSQVFDLIDTDIKALLFQKKIIQSSGMYNEELHGLTDFELLCRMAECTDKYILLYSMDKTDVHAEIYDEAAACTAAYIIRRHLKNLHDTGDMDRVFQLFCRNMQVNGLFELFKNYVNKFLSDENAYEKIARNTAPFIVLKGDDTCYGVLQKFADDISDGLAAWGQSVIQVGEGFTEYDKIQNMICKGVVGFQTSALEIDYFKNMKGPKFQFWFDNPLHFKNILRNLPHEYFVLCQDAGYASLIREYYNTENSIQFPPGGIEAEFEPVVQDRPYDIVFIGSCFEDNAEYLDKEQRAFYDYMLSHPELTFEQGLKEVLYAGELKTEKEYFDKDEFIEKMIAMKPACRMVIGHFRQAVIETILQAGYTLHVYGDDWNRHRLQEGYKLVIHPQVTVEESVKELKKAKIGLNIMSWHKSGMTERIANIMLSGAVCLSDKTSYLTENMMQGEDIMCFDLTELDKLPAMISGLLENDELRKKIAENAYRLAKDRYTWKSRAKALIELTETRSSII